jgi:hypothetical protein
MAEMVEMDVYEMTEKLLFNSFSCLLHKDVHHLDPYQIKVSYDGVTER